MQPNQFSRLEALVGLDSVEKLKKSTVMIVGIGGVGGYCCEAIARSFVGTIIIIDFDVVDITNINRQIIATNETIGKKKVDIMKDRINSINSDCNVISYDLFLDKDNISNIDFSSVDYVIDCCDSISTKKLLLEEMHKKSIPFISSMGTANKMDPSKLEIVLLDKTCNDPIARIMRKFVRDKRINKKVMVLSSSELPVKTGDRTPGSTAFVPSSAGLLIASYIVNKYTKK